MKRTGPYTGTGGHAYHHIRRLTPAIMDFSQVIYDLVEANGRKIGKLHFHDRFKSFQRQPQRSTYNGTFTQRGIANAVMTKLVQKPFCDFKRPAIFSNILSHED